MGLFRKSEAHTAESQARAAEEREASGGWYADPFGTASRRWYDNVDGWTDRVQGEGQEPDKTGVARVDDAMAEADGRSVLPESLNGRTAHMSANGRTAHMESDGRTAEPEEETGHTAQPEPQPGPGSPDQPR